MLTSVHSAMKEIILYPMEKENVYVAQDIGSIQPTVYANYAKLASRTVYIANKMVYALHAQRIKEFLARMEKNVSANLTHL